MIGTITIHHYQHYLADGKKVSAANVEKKTVSHYDVTTTPEQFGWQHFHHYQHYLTDGKKAGAANMERGLLLLLPVHRLLTRAGHR